MYPWLLSLMRGTSRAASTSELTMMHCFAANPLIISLKSGSLSGIPWQRAIRSQCKTLLWAKELDGKELGLAADSASKQEHAAEAEPVNCSPKAAQRVESILPISQGLPAPTTPLHSSEEAASSRSSSLSPQPLLRLQPSTFPRQRAQHLPIWAAPAARALPAPAAQGEESWQEVRAPRRELARQQLALKHRAPKTPAQGRKVPDEGAPAPSRLRFVGAEPAHAAAEQPPHWSAASTSGHPLQPLQHTGLKSLQISQPEPLPSKVQQEPLSGSLNGISADKAHTASQHVLHAGLHIGSSSHAQVHLLM